MKNKSANSFSNCPLIEAIAFQNIRVLKSSDPKKIISFMLAVIFKSNEQNIDALRYVCTF